jgi:hypothetical protein
VCFWCSSPITFFHSFFSRFVPSGQQVDGVSSSNSSSNSATAAVRVAPVFTHRRGLSQTHPSPTQKSHQSSSFSGCCLSRRSWHCRRGRLAGRAAETNIFWQHSCNRNDSRPTSAVKPPCPAESYGYLRLAPPPVWSGKSRRGYWHNAPAVTDTAVTGIKTQSETTCYTCGHYREKEEKGRGKDAVTYAALCPGW